MTTILENPFTEENDFFAELGLLEDEPINSIQEQQPWKILVIDDEPDIHTSTALMLKGFTFQDRGVRLVSVYSAQEAIELLKVEHQSFAVAFVDVIMEADDAGLTVVDFIRKELNNNHIRIVLRTGQPGLAPEGEIVSKYDIDDYKSKTEITVDKMRTIVQTSLRTYAETMRIEQLVAERTQALNKKHQEIIESINSALRIQSAILPSIDYISQFFSHFVVFYKPKHIVSGDLYWFKHIGGKSILANIDCTGHGVPGAIMSIFAYNLLNRVVPETEAFDSAQILTKLDIILAKELYHHANITSDPDHHSIVKAGMEMSLLVFDHQTNILTFSGANRPLCYFRDGVLKIIKGDRYPIGYYLTMQKTFTKHTLQIQKGDKLYLFTDGITDQFGSEKHVKYTTRRLEQFLLKHANLTLAEQMFELNLEFYNWKQQYEQTDDISFIGIEPCG